MRFASFVIATVAFAATARADKQSTRLFEEGRELSQQGKYQEACDRFARSYELEQATGTQVNMGDCEEHLGHVARAWSLFDSAAKQADREGNGVRAQYARRRANVLLPRLAAVVVTIEQPDERMQISIGGRDYMPGPEVRAYVDPGEIEIRAQLPGQQFKKSLRVAAGESTAITVPRFAASVGATTRRSGKRRSWVIAAGVLGGAGVVGLSTSAFLTIAASRGYGDTFADGECMYTVRGPECTQAGLDRVADSRSVANLATGIGIVSAAALVGGIVVYAIAPRASVEVAPMVSADSASLTLSGRF